MRRAWFLWLICTACGGRAAPVTGDAGPLYALSVDVPFAELDLPPDSRDGAVPPTDIPVRGPWKLVSATGGHKTYEAPSPIRPRSLFFFRPPSGMVLLDRSGRPLPYGNGSWRFTAQTLTVVRPESETAPSEGDYLLQYPYATEREGSLNLAFSGASSPEAFARTRIQAGPSSLAGLLLPAPGVAAWDVELPPSAELHFSPGLVEPETADGPPSDGVGMAVEVESGGKVQTVWEATFDGPSFEPVRVDLSGWSGQTVRLRFRTTPGATARFDYAFFADPVVVARKAEPTRIVMVFVDTLRVDHVSLFGYDRETTPNLDNLGPDAVVFEQARSVAPWTLPSTRALLTGRDPELWRSPSTETLPSRLRKRGWATAAYAANVYLSANFDMNRDWGLHHVLSQADARDQVDRALTWLDAQEGRDALLLVHLMDCHLPYSEPGSYRFLFAGAAPASLGEDFERPDVMRMRPEKAEDKQYVIDRYDNNVRYVDDQLSRVYKAAQRPQDVLVVFADHGEEFWDHTGFEHGHSLFDELLRVPLVIRAPGRLTPGRVSEPVSLRDVAPTLLDLVGLPRDGMDGTSLVSAAQGDATARAALTRRPQAFGRPLYGMERWGVLHDNIKYTTSEGREAVYELGPDPAEKLNLMVDAEGDAAAPHRPFMAEAIGRPIATGYRLVATRANTPPTDDLVVDLVVPGGIAAAWVGADPTDASAADVTVAGDVATVRWLAGQAGAREVYVIPTAPLAETTHKVEMRVHLPDGTIQTEVVKPTRDATFGKSRVPHANAVVKSLSRRISLTLAVSPLPPEDATALHGTHPESTEELRALGYLDGEL
jgi:arylsulfatase A-like enzyme